MIKGQSKFGAELDSLADFMNFGCAPALFLYLWGLHELGNVGWIAAMVFAICAALRLARFNVMIDDPNRPAWAGNFFTGVPAPAGALVVLLPIYVSLLGLFKTPASADAALHAHDRGLDGVAAAGVLRQAGWQARAAGNGFAGFCVGGGILRAADRLSVVGIDDRHGVYLAWLPFGWLSYREYERKHAAAHGGANPDRPLIRLRYRRRRAPRSPIGRPGSIRAAVGSRPHLPQSPEATCPAPPATFRLPIVAAARSSIRSSCRSCSVRRSTVFCSV